MAANVNVDALGFISRGFFIICLLEKEDSFVGKDVFYEKENDN